MRNDTWVSWTLKIGPKAYKDIRPLTIEMTQGARTFVTGYLWWRKEWTEPTGYWTLKFKYDEGPYTKSRVDFISFDDKSEAEAWYNNTWNSVFLNQGAGVPPPPPKSKKPEKKVNKPGLKLV